MSSSGSSNSSQKTQPPPRELPSAPASPPARPAAPRDTPDEEFSWHTTNFHIWPGEHCPVLKRQADMGLPIRTTDDDLEELRTS